MMRRTLGPLLLAVAGAVAVAGAAPAAAGNEALSFVQVVEKEWSLQLSRTSVKAGRVAIETVNFGTDAHDLVVQGKARGARPARFKQIGPRGRTERTLRLPAGRYSLWCSLPGHKAKGMSATLSVR